MNNCNFSGRLVKQAELSYTNLGKARAMFTIVAKRGYKDNGGNDTVDFIPCQIWDKFAERIHKYLRKGTCISVSGQINISSFEDKDGNKRSWIVLNVSDLELIAQPRKKDGIKETPEFEEATDDDVPF